MAFRPVISRGFSSSSAAFAIKNVTVIGGGLMGSGIAQVTAQSNHKVTLIDINDAVLQKASQSIKTNLQRVAKKQFKDSPADAEKFISAALANLTFSGDLQSAVKETDLVVEAVVESMDLKHKIFSSIDNVAPKHTIFASNTSSLSIGEIAAVTQRKDRFIGLHFFNPVPVMKLLEVVKTSDTSEQCFNDCMAWGKAIGKVTITCKDTPGFVVNRLLVPLLCEAIRMVERGDASPKDIDIAMKLGAGHPMGPLELSDYVGHDTTDHIVQGWHDKYPNVQLFEPVKTVSNMVKEGKLGMKTGEGFYKYGK